MDYLYLDTNALIKLYRTEKGSNWLKNFVVGKQIVISALALLESATVIGKYYRNGDYTLLQAVDLYNQIDADALGFVVISLDVAFLKAEVKAVAFPPNLIKGSGFVRALDAIHVASAQFARQDIIRRDPTATFTVVSSDGQLLKVAQAGGLPVENPEKHP